MNLECTEINDTTSDLVNNNCQKLQNIESRNAELNGFDRQHRSVYNNVNEGGGKTFQTVNNGVEMTARSGESQCKRKLGNIEERIETSVSPEGKDRISNILSEVNRLSDVEKFLLYLKLPTGSATEDVSRQTPTSALHSSNRAEQAQAFTWIRSHLEEDNEICVPKHEVFDDYKEYCDSHDRKSLCPADFGKVMKCVFPNVKARRLGQRGQSRYCYSGLRKKLEVQPPALPELEVCPRKLKNEDTEEDELFLASCQLVCEWAQKLLGSHFNSLGDLSEYLVGNHYVNSKSMAAFTVLAAMQDTGIHNSKVPVSMLFSSPSSGNKHRETQIQLQRKLQEREILKEQKKILQQQRFENEQEHEQYLQNKGLSLSQKNLKQAFPGKGTSCDISKLIQSPNKECRRRSLSESMSSETSSTINTGRNTVDISVLNSAKITDISESVLMGLDGALVINNIGNSHNNSGCFNISRSSSTSSNSSQQIYNVVKQSSVIQLTGENLEENGNTLHCESQAMDTNEKENDVNHCSNYMMRVNSGITNENSIFILPSNTPSTRSAFVPVSNQRKDSAFMNDPSIDVGVILSEMFQNDKETAESMKTENNQTNTVDASITVLKHDISGQKSKSLSPQTPRKSKNRFTPIKPKITPTKVNVAQKPPAETPAYDSRPVSAILKEKRAKEAIITQFTTVPASPGGSTLTGTVPVVPASQILRIPASTAGTKTNDVLIILGSSAPQSMNMKSGSIVSPSQIITNTAMASVSTQSQTINGGIITCSPHYNQVSSSSSNSVHQPGSNTALTVHSQISSQEETKLSQQLPMLSHNLKLYSKLNIHDKSKHEPDEKDINCVNPCNSSEMYATLTDINRQENDTPSRKRKCSDQEPVLVTKRMNSMEGKQNGDQYDIEVNGFKFCRSASQNGVFISKNVLGTENFEKEVAQTFNLNSHLNVESLEHDALLDSNSVAVDKKLYYAVNKNSRKETSSIGISAKSLRPSQKQLLKEKMQLDERIHNFLNKLIEGDNRTSQKFEVQPSSLEHLVHCEVQNQQTIPSALLQTIQTEKTKLPEPVTNNLKLQEQTKQSKHWEPSIQQRQSEQTKESEIPNQAKKLIQTTPLKQEQSKHQEQSKPRDNKRQSAKTKQPEKTKQLEQTKRPSKPLEKPKQPEQTKQPPEKTKQGCCYPVNLLSLLQQPIKFENPGRQRGAQTKRPIVSESSLINSKETRPSSNYITNRRLDDFSQSKIAELLAMPSQIKEREIQTECIDNLEKLNTKCSYNDNIEDGELPTDVAEFVTEALTARAQSRASNYSADGGGDPSFNDSAISNKEDVLSNDVLWSEPLYDLPKASLNTEADPQKERFIVPNTPPIRPRAPELSNIKYKSLVVQRSVSMPVFAVPSKPHPCQLSVIPQSPSRIDVISPVLVGQKSNSPHDFTSPPRKVLRRLRQPSLDQLTNPTPISDAGYHSFDASPVMNSTPIPPNDLNLMIDSCAYVRPESAHSMLVEQQIVSPISHTSPQPQRPSAASTPSSVMSPHCLSQSSINPSPVEYITSPNAFMPIQGISTASGQLINPRLVTPIRPVVTLADPNNTGTSAASATANQLLNIMKKAPGLTKAALQTHQRLLAQQLDPSGFILLNTSNFNKKFDITTSNGDTIPPNLSLINTMRLQSESPIQRSPSLTCSTPDDDMVIVSPKPKENISHQRNTSNSKLNPNSEVSNPPSYEEALKHIGRNKSKKLQTVTKSIPTSIESTQLLTQILTEELTSQDNTSDPVLSKAYPFSYQLALLHEKILPPLSTTAKQMNVDDDKSLYDIPTDLIKSVDSTGQLSVSSTSNSAHTNPSLQTVSGKIIVDSRNVNSQTQCLPDFQVNGQNICDQPSGSYPASDLPNVNYIGSAPNIDLSNILNKSNCKTVFCDNNNQTGVRSTANLQQLTNSIANNGLPPYSSVRSSANSQQQSHGIADEDLPPYLDILNLDPGQYFSSDDLNIENLHSTLPSSSESLSSDTLQYRSETLSS